jgi:polyribonucleotide nucleotidyltransferase
MMQDLRFERHEVRQVRLSRLIKDCLNIVDCLLARGETVDAFDVYTLAGIRKDLQLVIDSIDEEETMPETLPKAVFPDYATGETQLIEPPKRKRGRPRKNPL